MKKTIYLFFAGIQTENECCIIQVKQSNVQVSEDLNDDINSENLIHLDESFENYEDSENHELSENIDEHRNNFVSFPSLDIIHEDENNDCQRNDSGD